MSAGYSKRKLIDKLGIKPGHRVWFSNPPLQFAELLGPLPDAVEFALESEAGIDYIHLFVKHAKELEKAMGSARDRIHQDGMIWVSWPKQSSRLSTELKEGVVRRIGLANNLVDVKVASIDEDWSGLKFVIRLQDRKSE